MKTNLGIQLRNPLNIRYRAANRWLGLSPATPQVKGFCRFLHFDYGYRAAIVLVKTYLRRGIDTPAAIIARWAPPSENHTQLYIACVCGRTGFQPHQRLSAEGMDIAYLVAAMARQETGLRCTPASIQALRERFCI